LHLAAEAVEPGIQSVAEKRNARHDYKRDNPDKKCVLGCGRAPFARGNAHKVRKERPAPGEHPWRVLTGAGFRASVDELSC